MIPFELHRFILGLWTPRAFRDWLYAEPEAIEGSLDTDTYLRVLETDYEDPRAVETLKRDLQRIVVPLPPRSEEPDELGRYLVLGDELQAAGDPRGELIALQAGLYRDRRYPIAAAEAEILERHEAALLGPVAAHVKRGSLHVDWYMGYAARAIISSVTPRQGGSILGAMFAHPSFARLRALELGTVRDRSSDADYRWVVAALGDIEGASISTLRIDAAELWRWARLGDLSKLWRNHRRLRVLELNGSLFTLGKPDLPDLLALTIRSRDLSSPDVRAIAEAAWPSMERLELWFGDMDATDAGPEDLAPLLQARDAPALRHLALRATAFTDGLVDAMLETPLLSQLQTLDLSQGLMTDDGAAVMLSNSHAFAHLETIDVGLNYLSRDATARLGERFGPAVQVFYQKPADDPYEWRLVSTERFAH